MKRVLEVVGRLGMRTRAEVMPGVTSISNNQVEAYWKFDLSASYMITPHLQLFGVINNVADAWPSRSPYAVLANYASGAYYDKIGRAYTIGFDFKY